MRLRFDSRAIPVSGILLGILGVWLPLPPRISVLKHRGPLACGICAAALGVYGITHELKRLGWGAVASGLIGIGLGLLFLRSGLTELKIVFSWGA